MATGAAEKKQAKPAEPRPRKHLIASRQMDQRRLPEDSSSESVTRKDFLISVWLLRINELHLDAGRSRRRLVRRLLFCLAFDSHCN